MRWWLFISNLLFQFVLYSFVYLTSVSKIQKDYIKLPHYSALVQIFIRYHLFYLFIYLYCHNVFLTHQTLIFDVMSLRYSNVLLKIDWTDNVTYVGLFMYTRRWILIISQCNTIDNGKHIKQLSCIHFSTLKILIFIYPIYLKYNSSMIL